MDIDWFEVRRLMLTSDEAFPSPPWERTVSTLDATITPEQLGTAERCLRALYQGLQWASKYEIKLKHSPLPQSVNHFFLEDEHVIGIFRDCFGSQTNSCADVRYPNSLGEYIELQTEGSSFMVADLVLEKRNRRLVNRWSQNSQSKFLRDLLFPGLMGIVAHYAAVARLLGGCGGPLDYRETSPLAPSKTTAGGEEFLTHHLLRDVLSNAQASDAVLAAHSPLALFYDTNSPFNLDLSPVASWIAPNRFRDLSHYSCATAGKYPLAGPVFPKGYPNG